MQVLDGRTARTVSTNNCPGQSESPEHRAWRQDRALRRRVPPREAWRGCLGLALLLERPDDTEACGERALVRNEQVRWLALRDLPAHHQDGRGGRAYVSYANSAVAELRHGMPVLDFRRDGGDGVDFGLVPAGEYPDQDGDRVCRPRPDRLAGAGRRREFAVLNAVSAAMTGFAFFATDADGRRDRPAWAARRPTGGTPFRPAPPQAWLPRPYLALPLAVADRLFDLATEASPQDRPSGPRASRSPDARPRRVGRRFPMVLRDGFCAALAKGLKACTFGPEVYCGTCPPPGRDRRPPAPDWVPHRLRSQIDGARRVVYLPRTARVLVAPGQAVEAGDSWAEVLPPANREWRRRRNAEYRWATADEPCGGSGRAAHLLRLWFEQQVVWLAAAPDQVLVPADLIACAARAQQPLSLWWDTAPALPHYGWELQAAVFPPLPLRRWSGLRLGLPGDLLLDAGVADARFAAPLDQSTQRSSGLVMADHRHDAVMRRAVPASPLPDLA